MRPGSAHSINQKTTHHKILTNIKFINLDQTHKHKEKKKKERDDEITRKVLSVVYPGSNSGSPGENKNNKKGKGIGPRIIRPALTSKENDNKNERLLDSKSKKTPIPTDQKAHRRRLKSKTQEM